MGIGDFIGAGTSLVIKGVDLIAIRKEKLKYRKIYISKIKIELRDNLTLLSNRNNKNINKKELIKLLKDIAIRESVVVDLDYNRLAKKNRFVEKKHIKRKKEEKCTGWDCATLIDKISDKITGLNNYIKMVKAIDKNKSGITQRLNNLYYQMLLLSELIKER